MGIELADSIGGDAHKLLNVPYDCGFLFCRSGTGLSESVFQNANAPYLKSNSPSTDNIRSPLNIGLENSRRFRGLPVYTTLVAYGREGYKKMLMMQIRTCRAMARLLSDHHAFELLPSSLGSSEDINYQKIFIIVLFRAKNDKLNETLVKRINATTHVYCSETSWGGRPATRIAISNWQADGDSSAGWLRHVLTRVVEEWDLESSGTK